MSANSKMLLITPTPVQGGRSGVRGIRVLPADSRAFGQNTLQFFEEGERHENTGLQDTVLPVDEDTDAHVRGGSFDKIPRQKGALLTLALLGVGLVAGAALGVRALARTGWKVDASAAAMSRSPSPATPAPPAASVPVGTALPAASPPPPPAVPIAKPIANEAAAVGTTVESAGDGDAIPATGDNVPDYAIKHVKKLAQTPRKLHKAPGKSEPRKVNGSQDEVDQEADPATNGEVVEPLLSLRNPGRIEPPQQLSAPPEHPVPIEPAEADPFEP